MRIFAGRDRALDLLEARASSAELTDNPDDADDVLIERSQFLRWHPQLQVLAATDLSHVELSDVLGINIERCYVSHTTLAHVPALSDLRSVLLV